VDVSVRGQIDLGPHVHRGLEHQWGAGLEGRHLDLRRGDGLERLRRQRLPVEVGQRLPQRFLPDHLGADAGVDQLAGHLPLAEAGDLDLGGPAPVGGADGALQLRFGDLDGQLDLVLADALRGRFESHRRSS
jgi:hypothetical protein